MAAKPVEGLFPAFVYLPPSPGETAAGQLQKALDEIALWCTGSGIPKVTRQQLWVNASRAAVK